MPILLIDSYDSFSFNLRSLIQNATGSPVITIHNDTFTSDQLKKFIPLFSAIVIGPGPGDPKNKDDVGIIPSLLDGSLGAEPVPILGICLGFQSLCLSQGTEVSRLSNIKHGQVYKISRAKDDLFLNCPQTFDSVRYHSLFVPEANDNLEIIANTTEQDGTDIIMSVKHKTKPWYGVQYHPESICSQYGDVLVRNFYNIASIYNDQKRTITINDNLMSIISSKIVIPPLIENTSVQLSYAHIQKIDSTKSLLEIADLLHKNKREFTLLNSASNPGKWSIIGLPSDDSLHLTHSTEEPDSITLKQGKTEYKQKIDSVWKFISDYMREHLVVNNSNLPFIGGFMGIFSYEEGHYIDLNKLPKLTSKRIPDTKLVFVNECVVRDHNTEQTHIISLSSPDKLNELKALFDTDSTQTDPDETIETSFIDTIDEFEYKDLFHKCQNFLSSGDSYELCLTTNTKLGVSSSIEPWDIYRTLTSRNPAPYSAFFNFDDCVLISSSPEKFIHWDNDTCELRPIKGTVKKTPQVTKEIAEKILHTPKELGENLMIVDLIRHDLFELLKDVTVTKLMTVEEYSTVYQLVSVIKGSFQESKYSGIDILSRSLPPGSMTGAPKKRSVEILQQLENSRRGLYSGVCGYWSVENKADWSVIIRSIFHYKFDLENTKDTNIWRIGAGGAITVLSEAESEWQEMLTKLESALQAFKLSS